LAQQRLGLSLLPSLIELRSHEDSQVKRWAQRAVRSLGMEDPTRAVELDDPALLAAVIHAYAQPLDFAAMPVVVRLVDSDKQLVRRAAPATVARFGKNAICQLRELYAELTSQPADKRGGHGRTARELYAVLDRRLIEEAVTRLAKGLSLFLAGDLEAMAAEYDRLLARFPDFEARDRMAPGYAGLGAFHLEDDRLDAARDAYQRALRLQPDGSDATRWQAQLAFIDAERGVSRGVVDLDGYGRALALDPEHAQAAQAHDLLSGEKAARERTFRRLAAAAAAGLLIAFLLLLLRRQRQPAEAAG
jgi:tetratricopeptide (TPR) repeat protein